MEKEPRIFTDSHNQKLERFVNNEDKKQLTFLNSKKDTNHPENRKEIFQLLQEISKKTNIELDRVFLITDEENKEGDSLKITFEIESNYLEERFGEKYKIGTIIYTAKLLNSTTPSSVSLELISNNNEVRTIPLARYLGEKVGWWFNEKIEI